VHNQRGQFFLLIDKVRLVQTCDSGFEQIVADEGAHWAGLIEAWDDVAERGKHACDRVSVANAQGGLGEEQDGFQDGGVGEDKPIYALRCRNGLVWILC
jgi:hypothetical protein